MSTAESEGTAGKLLEKAQKRLGGVSCLTSHIERIRTNPEGLEQRCVDFDKAITRLNSMFRSGEELDTSHYSNVINFKKEIDGEELPLLGEPILIETNESKRRCLKTFMTVRDLIEHGEWKFPKEERYDSNKVATGMLIEGYSILVQNLLCHIEDPDLPRKCLLAIEEVLYNEFPSSPLTEDLLDWMTEEKYDFSPAIRENMDKWITLAS